MSSPGVSKLVSRSEFRAVLKSVVRCLRRELNVPGLAPLNAEEIHFWFQNITVEDIETVQKEIDTASGEHEHASRVQSMLQKIRDKMRRVEPAVEAPDKTESEVESEWGSKGKRER